MSQTINLKNLSADERKSLAEQLAAEEKQERLARSKKRALYEKSREKRIQFVIKEVEKLEKAMLKFKMELGEKMQEQHDELDEFGMLNGKSKGGFSIISKDGNFKVTRSRDTNPKWDETAHKGVELVQQFLLEEGADAAKPGIFNLLMGLISKNSEGELEYSKVMQFLKNENEFDHPKWKEGLRLIREGYSIDFKKFAYQFEKKDNEGKFQKISINFSNL
jgi:hypothetical protein